MERLQKVIANSGFTSRRKAEELIITGHVYVNGNLVTELGTKVNNSDQIVVDGVTLNTQEVAKEYYLLNKPRGYICSLDDEKNRHIVTELIDTKQRIYPVGRLDYDTTGLLILTNDGDLANILMHPSQDVVKTYLAKVEGILSMDEYFKLKEGIVIDGVKCLPKKVKIKKKDIEKNTCMVEISIVEGRNHIVKKLFKAINHEVIKLKRERYAFLDLGNLKSGEYRFLSREEVSKLYELKK
ncbi:MAG: pseudouridine synthase [Bacilli bacterium]